MENKRNHNHWWNDFKKDLDTLGEPCEIEFLEILKEQDKDAYKLEGKNNYDLVAPNLNKKYEVKNQEHAIKYVAIETSINDKLSGLSITEADFWVIKCWGMFHFIHTNTLKELLLGKREYKRKIEGNLVKMKLLSIQELKDNSLKIYTQLNNGGKQWKP